jgi:alkanesulfonate monooxygenase SsuD/methylene tetrahydromethanopterin reductase-like flavin-dependent oxidoreductase (luciferase family)
MRFGWLTLSLSPSPEEDAARIDQQIEQVRAAEQLGFGDVWLTEHYFTGESVYNDALLFASAVAMRTQRIRIGFAVVQLPFHHPVRLAVQLALLDNLSKGRIDVGVGKGTIYNEYEFVGQGLRSDDSRERMEEAVDIIGRLWRGDPRPIESVVSAKFSTATFAQIIDGSSQLALGIGDQIKGARKPEQDRQQRPHLHPVQQQANRFKTHLIPPWLSGR